MKKSITCIALSFILMLSTNLVGCGKTATAETGNSLKISYQVHSQTLKDEDGTDLAYLKITSPSIANPNKDAGITAIDQYYGTLSGQYTSTVLAEGKQSALDGKKDSKQYGFDFYPFEYDREPSIYYNANNLLSVMNLQYENTGGAHPNNTWDSATFDVKTGKKLTLADIFGISQDKVLAKVYELVLAQIEESKGTENSIYYFDDYKEGVKTYYSTDDFILTNDGIIFYYQRATIAPSVAGIQMFKLPYAKAGTLAVNIPATKSNDLENDLYAQAGRLIEANKDVFFGIFGLSMLALDMPKERADNEWVFPVKDARFAMYADLDGYIRNTYVKSEADALMGNGRYINKDGKLYGDMSKDAGVGYYVDWNDYRYEISDVTANSALLTIYTTDDSPAGKKEITLKVKMLEENDVWLLEKMFS